MKFIICPKFGPKKKTIPSGISFLSFYQVNILQEKKNESVNTPGRLLSHTIVLYFHPIGNDFETIIHSVGPKALSQGHCMFSKPLKIIC